MTPTIEILPLPVDHKMGEHPGTRNLSHSLWMRVIAPGTAITFLYVCSSDAIRNYMTRQSARRLDITEAGKL